MHTMEKGRMGALLGHQLIAFLQSPQVRLPRFPAPALKGQTSIRAGLCPRGAASLFFAPRGLI